MDLLRSLVSVYFFVCLLAFILLTIATLILHGFTYLDMNVLLALDIGGIFVPSFMIHANLTVEQKDREFMWYILTYVYCSCILYSSLHLILSVVYVYNGGFY